MFNFTVKPFRKKDGTMSNVILVTGDDVDSTYPYKEEMKQFGAKWMNALKTWGWYASQDSEKMNSIIQKMVKPAIEFLLSKEQNPNESDRDVLSILNEILKSLSIENTEEEEGAMNNAFMTKAEIQSKIYEFKAKLVNAVNDEDFRKLMEPIIKARQAQGYKYSLMNTIMIWCQDPEATMVKSRRNWAAANREVPANAPAIGLFVPIGGDRSFKGKEARARAKEKWLNAHNATSEDELTVGEKEQLRHYLDKTEGNTSFKFSFSFYDIRHTVQMEGKEDVVGNTKTDAPWFDDSGNETAAVKEKIECLLEVVKDSGVDVSKVESLGGALGVSMNGKIQVLDKAKLNSNMLMTIAHEFGHELLHQRYLKDNNPEFGQFYYGRPEGKGFVEQQAELVGWIVCQFYGYDMKTGINYAGIWGMNEKNAVHAFDTVAKVADFIINKTNEKIKERRNVMEEGKNILNEVNFTGADIAKMVGAEDVYKRGLEQIENGEEMKEEAIEKFGNLLERINKADKNRIIERYD